MVEWYLNITEEPNIDDAIKRYLDNLKPHKASQWTYNSKMMASFKDKLMEECTRIQNSRCVFCATKSGHFF